MQFTIWNNNDKDTYKDNDNKQCCGSSVQSVKNIKSRLDLMWVWECFLHHDTVRVTAALTDQFHTRGISDGFSWHFIKKTTPFQFTFRLNDFT